MATKPEWHGPGRREPRAGPTTDQSAFAFVWREFSPFRIVNAHGSTRGANFKEVVRVNAFRRPSELEAGLEGDHTGGAVSSKADAEQACRRRRGIGERAEASLRRGLTGNTGEDHAGKSKIGVVENIEELALEAHLHVLGQGKPF